MLDPPLSHGLCETNTTSFLHHKQAVCAKRIRAQSAGEGGDGRDLYHFLTIIFCWFEGYKLKPPIQDDFEGTRRGVGTIAAVRPRYFSSLHNFLFELLRDITCNKSKLALRTPPMLSISLPPSKWEIHAGGEKERQG